MAKPKRISLDVIHSLLSVQQVTDAWRDNVQANLTPTAVQALSPRIDAFNRLRPALAEGDRVDLDFNVERGMMNQ